MLPESAPAESSLQAESPKPAIEQPRARRRRAESALRAARGSVAATRPSGETARASGLSQSNSGSISHSAVILIRHHGGIVVIIGGRRHRDKRRYVRARDGAAFLLMFRSEIRALASHSALSTSASALNSRRRRCAADNYSGESP